MIDEDEIRRHYALLRSSLDERGRRLFAATQVRALGYGGIAAVTRATGLAPSTIGRGLKELDAGTVPQRVRRPGGGRKRLADTDATLTGDLLSLVEPVTLGDPMRPLLWVSKSQEKLATALRGLGHRVSANTVPAFAAEDRLQPPGELQGQRRTGPPRPRCPIRAYQCGWVSVGITHDTAQFAV